MLLLSLDTYQSAPNLNGYCKGGGPKVESIMSLALALWALNAGNSQWDRSPIFEWPYLVRIVFDVSGILDEHLDRLNI